jgi:acetoacetate decarboxylase
MLPKPLEAAKSGLCAAFGIRVGFSSAYGPFKEMGVVVGASFRGKAGFYLTSLFLDSSDAISAGREIYGSPKKYAEVSIHQCGNELTFACRRAGIEIITVNSRISDKAEARDLPKLWPMYVLKTVPRNDRNGLMGKQLCVNAPPEDVRTHELFKGPGVVKFEPTVAGDFWKLMPLEPLGAFYQEIDYTQGFGKVIHEYPLRAGE